MKTVERLEFDTLWYPESRGYESFSVAGFMLSQSSTLKLGSSIASIYARDAFTSRQGMISLNKLYGDRFILGLGVSHVPMVEGIRGHVYEKAGAGDAGVSERKSRKTRWMQQIFRSASLRWAR